MKTSKEGIINILSTSYRKKKQDTEGINFTLIVFCITSEQAAKTLPEHSPLQQQCTYYYRLITKVLRVNGTHIWQQLVSINKAPEALKSSLPPGEGVSLSLPNKDDKKP